jgi:hypothetical protein
MKIRLLKHLLQTSVFITIVCHDVIAAEPLDQKKQPRPSVRIGATQADIQTAIGNQKADNNQYTGEDHDLNFRVSAGFEDGVCNRIKYVSVNNQKFSDQSVSVILDLNSKGDTWIARVDSTPAKVTYLTIDGKYRAILTNRTELFVVTEETFQKSMRDMVSEKQKSN